MNTRRISFAPGFGSALRKLEPDVQESVKESVRNFRNRSAENALLPEKKAGLKGIWAFRVTTAIRVFYVQRKDSAGSYSEIFYVGLHNDYRTVINKKPPAGRRPCPPLLREYRRDRGNFVGRPPSRARGRQKDPLAAGTHLANHSCAGRKADPGTGSGKGNHRTAEADPDVCASELLP